MYNNDEFHHFYQINLNDGKITNTKICWTSLLSKADVDIQLYFIKLYIANISQAFF